MPRTGFDLGVKHYHARGMKVIEFRESHIPSWIGPALTAAMSRAIQGEERGSRTPEAD